MSVERKVRLRRIKRRLKASVSIVIALAAGTFLACQKEQPSDRPRPAPNPSTPEDPNRPAPERTEDAALNAAADALSEADVEADAKDAAADARDGGKRAVDKREHRKGMPVKDNLLE